MITRIIIIMLIITIHDCTHYIYTNIIEIVTNGSLSSSEYTHTIFNYEITVMRM